LERGELIEEEGVRDLDATWRTDELIEEEGVRDITTPRRIKNTKKEQQL
jgi:hypothetical protein